MEEKIVGVCHFCGQTAETDRGFETQEAADNYATLTCGCPSAKYKRDLEDKIEDAKMRVDQLFAADCDEVFGFEKVEDYNVIEKLYDMVEFVGRQKASSVTMALGRYGTAKIGITAKGKITVSRTVTNTYKLEE